MDVNFWAIFGLVTRIIGIVLLLGYVIPKQTRESQRPHDGFTRLRYYLVILPLIYLITSGPTLLSLFASSFIGNITVLTNISRVTSGLGQIAMALAFVLIYSYQGPKDSDDK